MRTMPAAPVSRLVLLAPPREDREPKIRRYRLARLKLNDDPRRLREESRYAHLKRLYD
jgi:hypothetical protein